MKIQLMSYALTVRSKAVIYATYTAMFVQIVLALTSALTALIVGLICVIDVVLIQNKSRKINHLPAPAYLPL